MSNKWTDTEGLTMAEGMMAMSLKGGTSVRVHLTKRRARILRFFMKEMVYHIPDCKCGDGDNCHCNDDYHAAIAWVNYQVNKRYSVFELAG